MGEVHHAVLAVLRLSLASTAHDVARLLGLPVAEVQEVLDELEASGLVISATEQ
ncbi:MAG TPA: hypothetical protein VFD92_20175 [Candidatus Binatia bacterium]|nr:hypothetical protein [Candidatus Binatia bacterium]